jgi:hypothetical protein
LSIKIVFLDVDGVLNCQSTKDSIWRGCIGLEDSNLKQLKRVISETDAWIILISSWKSGWSRVDKSTQGYEGNYLDKRLLQYGLTIHDKIVDVSHGSRGASIRNWLNNYSNVVEQFVIIDDEVFDYKECCLLPNLVQTCFYTDNGGLTEEHADIAIDILNNGSHDYQIIPRNFTPCSECCYISDCTEHESRDGCYFGEIEHEEKNNESI